MSPANGGDDRDRPVGPGGRDEIEERVRRALRARAEQINADTLRVQPMSDLDELAKRRERGKWILPVAVAAAVAAVVLMALAVPPLLDDPDRAPAAASTSSRHASTESAPTTAPKTSPSAPPSTAPPPPPPTTAPPTNLTGQQVQGPRGLVVTVPSGWVEETQQATEDDSCLLPSGAPPTGQPTGSSAPTGSAPTGPAAPTGAAPTGSAPPTAQPSSPPPGGSAAGCGTGVMISATEPGEQIEDVLTASCGGSGTTMDDVVTDLRPAAGATADYREYTMDCAGAQQHKAVWFLPDSQLAIVAAGTAVADPATQQIVDSIDLSNYAAIPPSDTTGSPPPPTAPQTLDSDDLAGREQLHRDRVTGLGYTPTTVTLDPALSMSCVVATDANGGAFVFFFVDDVYVGMDADRPSTSVSAALVADLQVRVTYTLSDASTVPVVFTWDGATLTPNSPIPPTAEENPAGPYR